METKANYVVVGVFTVLAVLAAFGFVYWTAAIGDRGETALLRVRIPGSASGLGRGSFVLFNGVRVGDVQRVYIDVQNPTAAIADVEVDRLTPITQSTRADIGIAGLTGQANIELQGGNLREPNLLEQAAAEGKVAEITANPSAVTNLLQTAQDIFEKTDSTLNQIQSFVIEVKDPLAQTVRNTEQFSAALAENADGIDQFLASAGELSETLASASQRIEGTLTAAEGLLNAVDRAKVEAIVANVEGFTADLRETGGGVNRIVERADAIVAQADSAVRTLNEGVTQGTAALGKVNRVLGEVDPEVVRNTLANVEEASRTANSTLVTIRDASQAATNVIADVEAITGRVSARAADVDGIITDAQQLAAQLNAASARVDGILQQADSVARTISEGAVEGTAALGKVNRVLGEVDPAVVREALGSIREASRVAADAAGDVARVTDRVAARGEDVDRIITDAQQLAARLNQASVRVDGVLQKVDTLLGSEETGGLVVDAGAALRSFRETADSVNRLIVSPDAQNLVVDASATLRSFRETAESVNQLVASPETRAIVARANETLAAFRQVADTLNGRIGTIADNLQRFSGQGLRGVEDLVRNGSRAITRIEQAVTDLERNPQRILSGGEGEVRRFNGTRQRR